MRCRVICCYFLLFLLSFLSCSNEDNDDFEELIICVDPDTIKCDSSDHDRVLTKDGFVVLKKDESIDFSIKKVSYWMNQITGDKSNQGGDCFKNVLCQFRADYSYLDFMDMKSKKPVATVSLATLGKSYHCNNADFSDIFYTVSDEFPLLYSSHQGKDARCILVDRINKNNGQYVVETVQRIDLPYEEEMPLQYTPDAIIDKDHDFLYVYTGNTITLTDFYIYQFRLPGVQEGDYLKLTKEDIICKWAIFEDPAYYKQGGMMKDGLLYIMEGVPKWNTDNILRIIDLKHFCYKTINLSKSFGVDWEPEDIFMYNDDFYITSMRSGIYHIILK